MFDVINDESEGFIMYKHEPTRRGFIHYHINHERVYVRYKSKGIFAWGVYKSVYTRNVKFLQEGPLILKHDSSTYL